jgi:hypothetical protein
MAVHMWLILVMLGHDTCGHASRRLLRETLSVEVVLGYTWRYTHAVHATVGWPLYCQKLQHQLPLFYAVCLI